MDRIITGGNHGIVSRFIRHKGYGYILELQSRKTYWFSSYSILQKHPSPDKEEIEFSVGQEVLFDIKITGKGVKPHEPKAVNIRTMEGKPFPKIAQDIMM